jgi:hypothetical protein
MKWSFCINLSLETLSDSSDNSHTGDQEADFSLDRASRFEGRESNQRLAGSGRYSGESRDSIGTIRLALHIYIIIHRRQFWSQLICFANKILNTWSRDIKGREREDSASGRPLLLACGCRACGGAYLTLLVTARVP